MNLDLYIFRAINQHAGQYKFLDNLAVFFADYFQYFLVLILLVIFLKNFKRYLPMMVSVAVTVFLSRIVITEAMRHFFFKLRPFVENHAVVLINQSPKEASMPSGHAVLFFALATAVYFYNKKFGIFFFISAFLIASFRVFSGIHWPSDILVGAIIGILSGWLVFKFFKDFFQKFSD